MYARAVDALRGLLSGEESEGMPCKISRMPEKLLGLANGIEYFSVEVTRADGAQYYIPAYGEEAKELYIEAMRIAAGGLAMAPRLVAAV